MESSWETRLFSVALRQRADEILEKVSPQKSADVSRRQREDTITMRFRCSARPALSLSLSPSTQPLFSIFSQSLFPHFLRRTNGRGKSRKSKSGNGSRGKSQLLSQRRKTAAVKKCSTASSRSYQVEERRKNQRDVIATDTNG